MPSPRILDIGCGARKVPGAVGIDRLPSPDVDIVADLDEPWPIPDSSFDTVVANHVLEHVVDVVHLMNEAWRVLRPGGNMIVRGPHFSSPDLVWSDPTHRRGLSLAMFLHFAPDAHHGYARARFALRHAVLRLGGADCAAGAPWWRRLSGLLLRPAERIANSSARRQSRLERIWSRVLPCSEVEVHLEAVDK